jgi:hypothetical protein
MRAGKNAVDALARFEGWIFEPGSPRRLAATRIGLGLLLAARLSRPIYLQLAGQPEPLFRPISFMRMLDSMPPPGAVLAVQVVAVAACLLGAAGVWARPAIAVGWLGALLLNGMWTSVGQPMHNETFPILAIFPLLFAPVADAWSLAPRRRRHPPPGSSVRYGWPVRTSMIVVAGGYFFSGFHKLMTSGPGWFLSDNLRWILYGISDQSPKPITAALVLASHPLLAHLLAASALFTELGFPLVLWKPCAGWLFLPGVVLLHLGIGLMMHLDYSAWAVTALVLFVPWDVLAGRRSPQAARSSLIGRFLTRMPRRLEARGTG